MVMDMAWHERGARVRARAYTVYGLHGLCCDLGVCSCCSWFLQQQKMNVTSVLVTPAQSRSGSSQRQRDSRHRETHRRRGARIWD